MVIPVAAVVWSAAGTTVSAGAEPVGSSVTIWFVPPWHPATASSARNAMFQDDARVENWTLHLILLSFMVCPPDPLHCASGLPARDHVKSHGAPCAEPASCTSS